MINSKRRISDCSTAHLIKDDASLSFKVKHSFSSHNVANELAKIGFEAEEE